MAFRGLERINGISSNFSGQNCFEIRAIRYTSNVAERINSYLEVPRCTYKSQNCWEQYMRYKSRLLFFFYFCQWSVCQAPCILSDFFFVGNNILIESICRKIVGDHMVKHYFFANRKSQVLIIGLSQYRTSVSWSSFDRYLTRVGECKVVGDRSGHIIPSYSKITENG